MIERLRDEYYRYRSLKDLVFVIFYGQNNLLCELEMCKIF